jgi:uncharacterized protein
VRPERVRLARVLAVPIWQPMSDPVDAPRAKCPICGKPAELKFRPFCSRRCADVDLNRWLKGVYAVPAREDEDERPAAPPRDEAS